MGVFFGLVLTGMFFYGMVDMSVVHWSNPDATHRRILIDHTSRILMDMALMIVPCITFLVWNSVSEDKKKPD